MSDLVWRISDLSIYLGVGVDKDKIHIYQSLASTNDTAKEMAKKGCSHGTVVLADSQTAGRGRFNRQFYSPGSTGLYMSIVLDVDKLTLKECTLLTPYVAVVVARVIHRVTEKKCGIKRVNDLYLEDKKVCGILTEGVMVDGKLSKFVVGIGINIAATKFPEELENIAGALIKLNDSSVGGNFTDDVNMDCAKDIRNHVAAEIINELSNSNIFSDNESLMKEYKDRQIIMGNVVTVVSINESYEGKVLDISANGSLIVERMDEANKGLIEELISGEVSIRR